MYTDLISICLDDSPNWRSDIFTVECNIPLQYYVQYREVGLFFFFSCSRLNAHVVTPGLNLPMYSYAKSSSDKYYCYTEAGDFCKNLVLFIEDFIEEIDRYFDSEELFFDENEEIALASVQPLDENNFSSEQVIGKDMFLE